MTYADFNLAIILFVYLVLFPLCLWFPSRAETGWYRYLCGGLWVNAYGYWHRVRTTDTEMVLGLPILKFFQYEDHRSDK